MSTADDRNGGGLAPLPTLPVFFKLRGRRALIAGGGEPAVWKAEVLCAAGAHVEVVAEHVCAGLRELAAKLGPAALRITERPWRDDDLRDAAIALGAIEEDGEAALFRDAAGRAGVPVNVVDKPAFCDFQFGTLVSRGPMVLAITTDGAAPVFGQAVRARLEAWLPEALTGWAQAAKDWRPQVQSLGWGFRRRRRFWERFADLALDASTRAPTPEDLEACFAAVDATQDAPVGHVTLVGSGPGIPETLTFGAARSLQTAEVLLYDPDLPAALVNLARREAPRQAVVDEDAGTALALAEAAAGKHVIWLGTGNPATCTRWRGRASRLDGNGVAVSMVDGLAVCPHCTGRCPGQDDSRTPDR